MASVADWILRGRWGVLLAAVAAAAWLGSYIPRIQFDSSSDGSVPRGDPEQAFFEQTIETFGNDQVSIVVVDAAPVGDVFNHATLRKIDRLTRAIDTIVGVEEVVSLTNGRYLTGATDLLETPPIIETIPQDPDSLARLREFVLGNDLFLKTLVSPDGQAAAINVFVRDYPDSVLIAMDLDGQIKAFLEAEDGPEDLHYAGLTYTRRIINATMKRDLRLFVPLTIGLIMLVLFLNFRSVRGVALPMLTVAMSTVGTMGLLGLLQKPMSLVMTILPPLLIAVGSSYSIHVVSHFNERRRAGEDSRTAARGTLQHLAKPVSMTAFTTIVGFGSLLVNPIPNISKMGVFAMAGIAITFVVSLTVLPAVLSMLKSPSQPRTARRGGGGARGGAAATEPPVDRLDRFLGGLAAFNENRTVWVGVLVLAIAVASVWGLLSLRVDTNFLSYFDKDSEIRQTSDIVSAKLAGASTFFLVVDGGEPGSIKEPALLQAVARIEDRMEAMPGVDKAVSIVGHLQRLHSALNYDDPDSLVIPDDRGVIEEEILLFSISHDPGVMERYVDGNFSQMTVFARTNLVGSSEILGALDEIEAFAREALPPGYTAKPTGTLVVLTRATEAVARGQRNSLGLALGIIFVVMTLLFRSLRAGLLSMVPNLVPILIVFGLMGWSGVTLNIGTSIIACVAIGISVDDTIHFLIDYQRRQREGRDRRQAARESIRAVGRPMVYTSVTLVLGFLILALSKFEMISSVGLLTGTTMLTALGADLVVLPAILISTRPVVPVRGRTAARAGVRNR